MSDEGFHEIQLNGKQLVFLFMAATVVSVVIFLCGVMVGRGVRDRTLSAAAPEAPASTAPTDTASTQDDANARTPPDPAATSGASQPQPPPRSAPQQPAATAAPPSDVPPTPPQEDDAYYDDLVKGRKDTLTAPKGRTAPATKPVPAPTAKNAPSTSPLPSAPAVTEHTSMSGGYAVQLAAVRERGEADAIAQRLVAKGYQAYVLVPQPGKPPVYRVQVGRFKSRGDADRVAARLRKNEQFKPWVTR
jgi:septal ring-binding cell division protein DamX